MIEQVPFAFLVELDGKSYEAATCYRWPNAEAETAYREAVAKREEAVARALEKKADLERRATATIMVDMPEVITRIYDEWQAEDRIWADLLVKLMGVAMPVCTLSRRNPLS